MYRVRSTDVWFNAPGVVAAYQPVAAPDSLSARQNVGNDARMAGRHTAMPGVLPAWQGAAGWTFNGTTQYLAPGIVPAGNQTWSALARFSGLTANTNVQALCGYWDSVVVANRFSLSPNFTGNVRLYYYASYVSIAARVTAGVMALAGTQPYLNGTADGAALSTASGTLEQICLGANKKVTSVGDYFNGSMQAFAISSITLSPAHMAQYSRQMAYCHVNPDWSAWGRRRQYFYAPSAVTAGNVGIYGKRGAVALPGGVRIEVQ